MPPPEGATKWYPYSPNRRAGNDSIMCPLHRQGVRFMHTSKIRPVFLCLQMKQHELDFPTRQNGKTIILFYLFIRSGLYSGHKVTFIVSVISRETS